MFKTIIKKSRILNNFYRKLQQLKPVKAITGTNNIIRNKGSLSNIKYDIIGNNNLIIIEKDSILSQIMIYMRGDNHSLVIGEHCECRGGSFWFEDNSCRIEIGKKTTIESAHLAVTEPGRKISIGEDCMFSTNIEFRTGDSHSIIDLDTNKRINYAENIQIDNHVWIGANSIILKGVKIEQQSVIATNSVVTKNIPAHSIAAGVPAKVIRQNIKWSRARIYD